MGGDRKKMLVGLVLVMMLGIAVYLRLWTIDYSISSDDSELIRRQFDLANREAMDESAEWRWKYDQEADKAYTCIKELRELKESFERKEAATSVNQKLQMLQKENLGLIKQLETLKQELAEEKLKCQSP